MKTDLVDVTDTRKTLRVELPSETVDAEIARVAGTYARKVRIPGFRAGKAPARVVKQRFREEILNEVLQHLVTSALDRSMEERGLEPVDTPDVRDITVAEGQPLTFTASFDTLPPIDPGDYTTIAIKRPAARVEEPAVDEALEQLRQRAARHEAVEGRGVVDGDILTVDLARKMGLEPFGPGDDKATDGSADTRVDVTLEMGAAANPPGFDAQLLGLEPGAVKTFTIHFPADYAMKEMADTDVTYTVTLKAIKRRVVPDLDDEFAKDLGDFEALDALRARVRADLEHQAGHAAEHEVRDQLMKQLAARLPFAVPDSLVQRETDRRIEDFAQRLVEQRIDPRQAGIDWNAFRESQVPAAREAVASALVLDAVARRESLAPTEEEIAREIERYAERSGRTAVAVRAVLEKEGGMGRVSSGLRREKSIDFIMARATIATE